MPQKTVITRVEEQNDIYGGTVLVPQNRVLYADTFSNDLPVSYEDHELFTPHTIDEVFEHYRPMAEQVELSAPDDEVVYEDFRFRKTSDFGDEELIAQSELLSQLNCKISTLNSITRKIEQNRDLRRLLGSEKERQALLNILITMKKELDGHVL